MLKHISFLIVLLMMVLPAAADITDQDIDNATAALDNLTAADINIDLNDYPFMVQITTWDRNKTVYENYENIASAPIDFWEDQIGYWIYVVIIFATIIYVYGKSKSIEVTSMVTILLSLLVILPSFMSMIIVPVPVLVILYVFATLGFGAILLSLFG